MSLQQWVVYVIGPVIGYLSGSVPWALLIGLANGVDIRTVGSKNVGATNLGRTLGKKFFWYGFLLDAAKGFVPVIAVALLTRSGNGTAGTGLPSWGPLLTAMACVIGHTYPVWLKFKGGKGVATSFGVLLGIWPIYTLGALAGGLVFIAVFMVYRYISLASIVGTISFTLTAAGLALLPESPFYVPHAADAYPLVAVAAVFTLLIIARHRANIARLLAGTEPKYGSKKT